MDFTFINKKNIKISLSKSDLDISGISAESIDYSDITTKRFLKDILDIARDRTGFDTDDSKLIFRLFASADGGCELFVTKSSCGCSDQKSDREFGCGIVCAVRCAEDLYLACERLYDSGFFGKSSLYCSDDGDFFLVLYKARQYPSYIKPKYKCEPKEFEFISEYGKTYFLSEEISAYLSERMKLLALDDAVERITAKFS